MLLVDRRWGRGARTALLVHGLFSDSGCWYRLGPALAERGYTVLAPDLRGHGISAVGRYSPQEWAADVVDTYRGQPIDLVVGHSLGGLVAALTVEVLGPQSVVYLDPAWRITAQQDDAFRSQWAAWLEWTGIEDLRRELGSRWPEADLQLRWASMLRTDPQVVPGLAAGGGYDHSPRSAIVASLVLGAQGSEYITDEHAAELRRRGLQVETVPDTGHSWFREDFDAFLARLDDWLADGRADPAR